MRRRIISICLSLAVAMTMGFCGAGEVFAGTQCGFEAVGHGSNVKAFNAADVEKLDFSEVSEDVSAQSASVPVIPLNTPKVISGSYKQFKVFVPAEGCLTMSLAGFDPGDSYIYGVDMKTAGFSDYVWFSSTRNIRRYGVKRGWYTFYVNTYGDNLYIRAHFAKIVQSKYGTKKSKASKIKKKKIKRGVLPIGAQKTHWYKFKNTKKHKVTVTLNSFIAQTGDYSGGIKISFYKGKKLYGSSTIYEGEKSNAFNPYNASGNKLKTGTYYIKIQSVNGGSGHFTLTWK